jgi:hypothetical protein
LSELQNPHQLVEQAFEHARRSGKPDRWVMAIPVLKNRMLQLTGRKFREADYGAKSFREFLRNFAEIQETPLPGQVTLRSAATAESPSNETKSSQPDIRPDLWEAVLDFSSGSRYIWDVAQGRTRVAREDEQTLLLPTITARDPTQKGWHALERLRRQRNHRSALRQTQRKVRGFLGTSRHTTQGCRMTSPHKSELHPHWVTRFTMALMTLIRFLTIRLRRSRPGPPHKGLHIHVGNRARDRSPEKMSSGPYRPNV